MTLPFLVGRKIPLNIQVLPFRQDLGTEKGTKGVPLAYDFCLRNVRNPETTRHTVITSVSSIKLTFTIKHFTAIIIFQHRHRLYLIASDCSINISLGPVQSYSKESINLKVFTLHCLLLYEHLLIARIGF